MKTNLSRLPLIIAAITFITFMNTNLYSQVTIGSDATPPNYSLLELDATVTKGGMHLPKINSTERDALTTILNVNAQGLLIWNTDAGKLQIWLGSGWGDFEAVVGNPCVITSQPRSFNWKEKTGAGNLEGVGGQKTALEVSAANALSYQWYELPINASAVPVNLGSENGAQTPSYMPTLTELGMKHYYCEVTGTAGDKVQSEIARVAVGCGALGNSNKWITFMCYNLGADPDKTIDEQKVYTPNPNTAVTTDSTVYGHLFQWGRIADGHQRRDSPLAKGGSGIKLHDYSSYREQVRPDSSYYGHFLYLNTDSENSGNWRPNDGLADIVWRPDAIWNDPCPPGWLLPTSIHFRAIIDGYSSLLSKENATSNTITQTALDAPTKGFEFKPDGVTTPLFLSFGGFHLLNLGNLYASNARGVYWTSEPIGAQSYALELRYEGSGAKCVDCLMLSPLRRAYGAAVRCVKF
jgi:hypothetical protein